jgi:hypothetical protein
MINMLHQIENINKEKIKHSLNSKIHEEDQQWI